MIEVENFTDSNQKSQNNEKTQIGTDVLATINTSSEETVIENSQNKKFNMFITYGKEIICILALILTTFASQNA
jgi:hypothetical protein